MSLLLGKKKTLFIIKLFRTDILKVFSLTAVATIVKGITGFISVKVIAVIIGSSGIAMLGQLTNFSSIIMTLATGGIGNGVVKFVAEHKSDPDRVNSYLSTAIRIVLFSSFSFVVCNAGVETPPFNELYSLRAN